MPFLSVETCSLEASISRNTVTVSAFTVASVAAVGVWERWPGVVAGKQKPFRAKRKNTARSMVNDRATSRLRLYKSIIKKYDAGGSPSSAVQSRSAYTALFFFQAEDGIRDSSVTGVQTCALPI